MGWLSLVSGLAKLFVALMDYFERRQLMKAGEAKATNAILKKTLKDIDEVKRARSDAGERERVLAKYTDPDEGLLSALHQLFPDAPRTAGAQNQNLQCVAG